MRPSHGVDEAIGDTHIDASGLPGADLDRHPASLRIADLVDAWRNARLEDERSIDDRDQPSEPRLAPELHRVALVDARKWGCEPRDVDLEPPRVGDRSRSRHREHIV
jgi:hypothetical protein